MKFIIRLFGLALVCVASALLELLLLNSSFLAVRGFHAVLVFFLLCILYSKDSVFLFCLPVAAIFLEQFTALDFGVVTLALFVAVALSIIVLRRMSVAQSFSANALVGITAVLSYETFMYLSPFAAYGARNLAGLGGAVSASLYSVFLTVAFLEAVHLTASRFSKSLNPGYLRGQFKKKYF